MQLSGGGRSPKRGSQRAKRTGGLRRSEKCLWIVAAATAAMILLALVRSGPDESSPRETQAPRASVARKGKGAAVSPPETVQRPPRPAPQPLVWKVLFASPKADTAEVSRRAAVKLFFNNPVERDVVEWAFSLSPSAPGTLSWPRADQMVFTPNSPLAPATEYTVSLTPSSGFHDEQEYQLLEARWSFSTGKTRTYREDIQPLIGAYCVKCHGSTGDAAAIPLATYSDISRHVVPSRSKESRLYTFIQARKHHINMAGPNHSTSQKLVVIKDWIDEDAAAE